jgi:GNAT superfamily N-acetyltransferase
VTGSEPPVDRVGGAAPAGTPDTAAPAGAPDTAAAAGRVGGAAVQRPATAPLRIWLEPGYDGGRVGTWLLDVPGAFGWAPTTDRALSNALSVAGGVREWLEEHGDDAGLPSIRGWEIVETWTPDHHEDGTERKACFEADRRAVPREELDAVIRRLGFAHDDLLALLDRLEEHESAHGPLPALAGEDPERTAADVLAHVARAEGWLVSRLDAAARSDSPAGTGDPRAALAAIHPWTVARLGELFARDPAAGRVDGKGEEWTLAKVLRRLLYHALDHLWELERRLMTADGTRERIDVTLDRRPPLADAVRLLRAVGWDGRADYPEALEAAIAGSGQLVAAWHGDRLVGMARCMTDGSLNALIATVVVHPRFQGLGVGRRMMSALMDPHPTIRFSLSTAPGADEWYRTMGFEPDHSAMVRRRQI